jgi:hypothetical protein
LRFFDNLIIPQNHRKLVGELTVFKNHGNFTKYEIILKNEQEAKEWPEKKQR